MNFIYIRGNRINLSLVRKYEVASYEGDLAIRFYYREPDHFEDIIYGDTEEEREKLKEDFKKVETYALSDEDFKELYFYE